MRKSLVFAVACSLAGGVAAQTVPTMPAPAPSPTLTIVPTPFAGGPSARPQYRGGDIGFAGTRYYADLYQNVLDYGRCAVHIAPERSKRLIEAQPNTLSERVEARTLNAVSRACLPYGYRAPILFLRAGVAEALYKQRGATAAKGADLAQLIAGEAHRDESRFGDDRHFMHTALCVAARAPQAVDVLLRTKPGSQEERDALATATRRSGSCISGSGQVQGNGGTAYLRAYLAESAYRADMS